MSAAGVGFDAWLRDALAARPDWPENLIATRSVDSTQRLGRTLVDTLGADDEVPRPTFILAWEQSAGRGRLGRSWESPAGRGLYSTVVWPVEDRASLASLPLRVAVALCEGLSGLLPLPCRLKWPNDLMARGRKLGGILIESATRAEQAIALIGLGVNLTLERAALPAGATSLSAEGARSCSPAAVLGAVVPLLRRYLGDPEAPEDLLRRYREASAHTAGEALACRVGGETLRGSFAGFDDSGFLRLSTISGVRTVSAGEIIE
jgi:BirA family biotin operon repressor/biotin-[acetyl-CoA-carboxylase] ligase